MPILRLLLLLAIFALSACGGKGASTTGSVSSSTGAAASSQSSSLASSVATSQSSTPAPLPITPPPDAGNTVTLRNASGAALSQQPLQFGRVFRQGEIADYPGLFLNGSAISSQAEVTQRWGDGSVRYAVLSTVLPSLGATGTSTLSFGSTSNAASPRTVADLLAQFADFDARIELTQGTTTHSLSARSMMLAGQVQWLAQGPLRYELLVADHVGRSRDVGFDAYKPLRPVFHVAFWPTLGKVRVRAVVESPNLDALEDVQYDAQITLGLSSPTTVYSRTGVPHIFGSRWSKTFWIGGAPEQRLDVDHNLAYLSATGMVPNYDTGNVQREADLAYSWSYWQSQPHDIYDRGFWTTYMPTTGMRGDIGPMPEFVERWLSSGDWRLREISLAQADLAGAWPLHFREHDASLKFDRAGTVLARGKPLSLNARPAIWFPNNNGQYPGALLTPRLPGATNWAPDGAHQPDPFGTVYLLTGDAYYLESLQLWAASQALAYAPGQYGRGKDGYGGITDQTRGNAWVIRSRSLAAALSPDGSAEKRYFYQLVEDAVALWEGQRGINDARFNAHPNRVWGATNAPQSWSPLRFWYRDTNSRSSAMWQEAFFLMELGIVRDMGMPVDSVLQEYSRVLTSQFTEPGYDPRYMGIYWAYTMGTGPSYTWYPTWTAFAAANDAEQPTASADAIKSFEGQSWPFYGVACAAASAVTTPYSDGLTAWYWLKAKIYDKVDMTHLELRRWKVMPRASIPPAPPAP
ncbi:MAG: hypothetical protein QM776_09575 [Rhodocyclaceae bacterium]